MAEGYGFSADDVERIADAIGWFERSRSYRPSRHRRRPPVFHAPPAAPVAGNLRECWLSLAAHSVPFTFGGDQQVIDGWEESYDPHGWHSTAVNTSRITISGATGAQNVLLLAYMVWTEGGTNYPSFADASFTIGYKISGGIGAGVMTHYTHSAAYAWSLHSMADGDYAECWIENLDSGGDTYGFSDLVFGAIGFPIGYAP